MLLYNIYGYPVVSGIRMAVSGTKGNECLSIKIRNPP